MTKDEIIKALRDMAKYPTVTLPRDCEALRMAADLLAQPEHGWTPERIAGMARLKDAQDKKLAQPEQEPFAFLHPQKGFYFAKPTKILVPTIVDVEPLALYTTPSLHKRLSDEKLKKIWYDMENIMGWYSFQEIARAIEAAHGIKGEA